MKRALWVVVACFIFTLIVCNYSFAKEKEQDKETGNVVSQAAHKAQAEGLKGEDLAAKVHEAIEERKESREKGEGAVSEEKAKKHKMHKQKRKGRVPHPKAKVRGKK